MTSSWHNLEAEWREWDEIIQPFRDGPADRQALVGQVTALWIEIAELTKTFQKDLNLKDPAIRYYGLDPLKISALKLTQEIETGEVTYVVDYLQVAHHIILGNIIKHRLFGVPIKELQTTFTPAELSHFSHTIAGFANQQEILEETRQRLQEDIKALRQQYEEFLFTESSYEAARSFGSDSPNIGSDRHSWDAFAQFLTSVALKLHGEHKAAFMRRCRKIEATREQIFADSAELLGKLDVKLKDTPKIHRLLKANLAEIKRLEAEIETTLAELDVPGVGDQSSFVVKKSLGEATTLGPITMNKTSQSTGDKT